MTFIVIYLSTLHNNPRNAHELSHDQFKAMNPNSYMPCIFVCNKAAEPDKKYITTRIHS